MGRIRALITRITYHNKIRLVRNIVRTSVEFKENKMNKTFKKFIVALLIASLFVFPRAGVNGGVQAQDSFPPTLEPYLSADGLTLYNGVAPLVVVVDPNPAMQGIKIPAPEVDKALADPAAASATFSFTYVAAGNQDPWGQACTTFPEDAKTAFNAAAAIWASRLQSSVPITIQACWASLSDPNTLGYSGGQPLHGNFSGAPKTNTWYEGALANALYGNDLKLAAFDMNITYNSNFTWYYGTDSNTPAGQYDLVTVAAHEIAHGLNFSGSADYSGGLGSYGYEGYPNVYDTFMEDNGGTKLTSYPNPSAELGTLLTSGSLWFNGSNANAANGGTRVKMYAPPSWDDGSSYGHLDEIFNGTVNDMMTYSVAAGSANHNPGPVTTGLLKDLGWVLAGERTISGNAGVDGATLSYTDGTPKTATANGSGLYSFAVPSGWSGTVTPSKAGTTFSPANRTYTNVVSDQTGQNYTATAAGSTNLLQDPSFEAYTPNPYWTETSTNFGTPLCTVADCDTGGETAGPRTGSAWSWFGGTSDDETGSLSQTVTIPSGSTNLEFYLWIGSAGAGSDAADVFIAKIDGVTVFSANATQISSYPTYTLVTVDVSAYANGASHTVMFSSITTGQTVTFNLDDVALLSEPPRYTISGNAGVGGAALSYTDGTHKTATADGSGLYSFTVPSGWSDTVTPSKTGYTFTPVSIDYDNMQSDQTGQNYTATVITYRIYLPLVIR